MSLTLAGIAYVHTVQVFRKGLDTQGPYYDVEYVIDDWTAANDFSNALVGIDQDEPHRYPESPNCVCTSAHIEGKGRVALSSSGEPSYRDGARIRAFYRSGTWLGLDPPGELAHQIDPGSPLVWCTQELDFETETLSVPNTTYKWLSDETAANIPVQFDVPITVMNLTFHRRSALPLGLVRELRGSINSETFLGAEPGKVWFVGGKTIREASTDGNVSQKVQLIFKERAYDWNTFLRPGRMPTDADAWDYLMDAGANFRFPEKDLRPLIEMP